MLLGICPVGCENSEVNHVYNMERKFKVFYYLAGNTTCFHVMFLDSRPFSRAMLCVLRK